MVDDAAAGSGRRSFPRRRLLGRWRHSTRVTADPPADAIPIAVREFHVDQRAWLVHDVADHRTAAQNGFIVWQWELVGDDAERSFPGVMISACPSETTRVTMPTLTTQRDGDCSGDRRGRRHRDHRRRAHRRTDLPLVRGLPAERSRRAVCDASTLVDDSVDEPIEVNAPGAYASAPVTLDEVGTYFWIATLRTSEGEIIAAGECGDPGETTEVVPFVVATEAVETDRLQAAWRSDVATIVGPTPVGATITFAAYRQGADAPSRSASDDNRVVQHSARPARPGRTRGLRVADGKLERPGTYLWVETVRSRTGDSSACRRVRGAIRSHRRAGPDTRVHRRGRHAPMPWPSVCSQLCVRAGLSSCSHLGGADRLMTGEVVDRATTSRSTKPWNAEPATVRDQARAVAGGRCSDPTFPS